MSDKYIEIAARSIHNNSSITMVIRTRTNAVVVLTWKDVSKCYQKSGLLKSWETLRNV